MAAFFTLRDADEPLGDFYGDYYVWEIADHLIFYLWESAEHKLVDEIQPLPDSWDKRIGL